ncbi:MAG: Gfo/Idh/MocA family oxidoreductase [Mycobacteriales bacterium]
MPGSNTGPFRWGFIGAGNIAAKALAPAVQASDEAVIQAVAAREVERARKLEPVGRAYDDYAALCADPEVDGVYISLHNSAHLEWIKHALAAGKHVLCEKPLCLNEAETAEAFEAAAAADRVLVEAFWYRWHPRTRRAEQLMRDGAIGAVEEVETAFCFGGVSPGNIRLDPLLGGGALYDVGCYTVSAAHWALGELEVTGASARLADDAVDLETEATLSGPSGTARISCSIDSDFRDVIMIRGSDGALEFTGGKGFSARRDDVVGLRILGASGDAVEEPFGPVDAYRLMAESFARLVRGEGEFTHTPSESMQVAYTMDAIRSRTAPAGPATVPGFVEPLS